MSQRFRLSRPIPVFLLPLLCLLPWTVVAQDTAKPDKLFAREDALVVTMNAPWRDLQRKADYQDGYPARIEYRDESGQPISMDMSVERRGVKRQAVCEFPPVRLRFEKETVKGTAFRGQKSLKMVTHCNRSRRYEQYVELELLVYRMYSLLTDHSFRVRPLQVTYVDSASGRTDGPRLGFLIEDDSDVAKRHDMKKVRTPNISPQRLQPELVSVMALFQFLVGNVDWAALSGPDPSECCHNIKLIATEPFEQAEYIYALPYDFDSAGLVDAEYAAPPAGLGINSVTQRLFRGYCAHNATLPQARQAILAREADLMALIADDPILTSSSKKKALRYLERGFETLRDDKRFDREIIQQCRK